MPDRRLAAPLVPSLRAAAAALVLAAAACGGPTVPEPVRRPPGPGELPEEAAFLADVDRSRGRRDIFAVIRDPEFVAAGAAHGLSGDEQVLGLDLGVAQVAYPVNLLNHHENVEHTLAGVDLLVCW